MPAASDPPATADAAPAIAFGPFRFLPAQRLLLEGNRAVRLGSRAFDILTALVERAGEVVGKDELIARAWPQTFVEETNLKIQVHALRRALGDGQAGHRYVITVPGRGYNFVAPVSLERLPQASPWPAIAPAETEVPNHNLPYAITRMIGREDAVSAIMSRLSHERLVTVVGAGGIGKTTIALAVTEQMVPTFEHGVWLVDLAPLSDPRLVVSTVAAVLDLEIHTEDPLPSLIAALRDRRMLLLLDNCEHVIDVVVHLAATVLRGAPSVHILATSREPLGVEGEHVYRLRPLSSPQSLPSPTAAEAAAFPAIQLFVERVTAVVEDFTLTDADAPLVAEICQRLDGLPLAIEFAAPRVEVLGIDGLATHLGGSLPQLRAHRRASAPRHRTMRSVVDWSYNLLASDEQNFFRSLGIFAGGFTIEATEAVAMTPVTTPGGAIERLAGLVAKSLIVADLSGAHPRFRLLETTRAYAIEKLDGSNERERLAHRHAEYYCNLFERAEGEAATRPPDEWLADYARDLDNVRAALDWAFSPGSDGSIAVALTTTAVPLWMRLSLIEECRDRTEQGLASLRSRANRDARSEMKLHVALAASLRFTKGAVPKTGAAWTKALEIAESLEDPEHQLQALWGLWFFQVASNQHRVALKSAQRLATVAMRRPDPNDRLIGEQAMGTSRHFLGDQPGARRHIERVLANYVSPEDKPYLIRFQLDLRVMAQLVLARILWLQGLPDQAMLAARSCVEGARAANHSISLCYTLYLAACPIALLVGDLGAAEHYVEMLLDHSKRFALTWLAWGRCYQGALVIKRGDVATGLRLLRAGFDELGEARSATLRIIDLVTAEALGRVGRMADGLAAVDQAIEQSERTEERWAMAEMLRVKGELLLLQSAPRAAVTAEDHFRKALNEARQRGALSWELRAAISLARLLRDRDRLAEAVKALRPVYDRFTEGFDTADLVAANGLLQELRAESP